MDINEILSRVLGDRRYQSNIEWGEPRPGHPEGSIRAHIEELESNLAVIENDLTPDYIGKLRLLIHTHDTFKRDAAPDVSITHPRSHASLARQFLAELTDDEDLLIMVQLHDEPFALFRQVEAKGKHSDERMQAMVAQIKDWDLFLIFCIVDGMTGGKDRDPLDWFLSEIVRHVRPTMPIASLLQKVIAARS